MKRSRLIDECELIRRIAEIPDLRKISTATVGKAISECATIDAEPVRHGQWDKNGRCTNCGGHAPYWAMATTYYTSPYCFECGAKMDLEEEK